MEPTNGFSSTIDSFCGVDLTADVFVVNAMQAVAAAAGGMVAPLPQLQEAAAAASKASSSSDKAKNREQNYFVGVRKPENKQEVGLRLNLLLKGINGTQLCDDDIFVLMPTMLTIRNTFTCRRHKQVKL